MSSTKDATSFASDDFAFAGSSESEIQPSSVDDGFEEIKGKAVSLKDGEFYVATEKNADFDLSFIKQIEVVTELDKSETIVFVLGDYPLEEKYDFVKSKPDKTLTQTKSETSGLDFKDGDLNAEIDVDLATVENYIHTLDNNNRPHPAKSRHNRRQGNVPCPVCNETFVSKTRMERHMAVHRDVRLYLCPLCQKSYKYQYNLFTHWRKSCAEINKIVGKDDRKAADINDLRQLAEDLAQKKMDVAATEHHVSFGDVSSNVVEDPDFFKHYMTCNSCGINVLGAHMPKHYDVHSSKSRADQPSVAGSYFCDLCGLIFQQRDNLYLHWRTNCFEIMANLPTETQLVFDDDTVRDMVENLLHRNSVGNVSDFSWLGNAKLIQSPVAKLKLDLSTIQKDANDAEAEANDMFDRKWIEDHVGAWILSFNSIQGIVYADSPFSNTPSLNGGGNCSQFGQPNQQLEAFFQCPECYKLFVTRDRMEKHIASRHVSIGTHHCSLCGFRFVYDYNLLYHYRRSCPYTKAYIDGNTREQINSTELRKLVRQLAAQQLSKPVDLSLHLTPVGQNDVNIHREMLPRDESGAMIFAKIHPHNIQSPRPGLPHGYKCPHCEIVFYGTTAIKLHMHMRHHEVYEEEDVDEHRCVTVMPFDALVGQELIDEKPLKQFKTLK